MDSGKKKILIADDEPDILEILGYNLQTEGYTVIKAKDGLEAIELSGKYHPDLLALFHMNAGKTTRSGWGSSRILNRPPIVRRPPPDKPRGGGRPPKPRG